jgi:dTDP-4-amino-4,6-dideoxygalactose transaminase
VELSKPAIEGGSPVRATTLPYARQWLGEEEIAAVTETLRSDWITTGPRVVAFESAVTDYCGARHTVAVTSCTAALHLALNALGVGPGHEVITTSLTFSATPLAAVYNGATPVFADIDPVTLNINPDCIEEHITPRTRAIAPVHYAGCPCDMDPILALARKHGLAVVEDAAHAIGAVYRGRPIGTLSDITCFSFHAVKNMTTAEGGAAVTDREDLARTMRTRRFFGVARDAWSRASSDKPWEYDVSELGFKYNITDIQAALGLVQIKKLDAFLERRKQIAAAYDAAFSGMEQLTLCRVPHETDSAHHLYVVRIRPGFFRVDRDGLLAALRSENIAANVHYKPVHLHSYFMNTYQTKPGSLPECEQAGNTLITLPLFPAMSHSDVQDVIQAVQKLCSWYAA